MYHNKGSRAELPPALTSMAGGRRRTRYPQSRETPRDAVSEWGGRADSLGSQAALTHMQAALGAAAATPAVHLDLRALLTPTAADFLPLVLAGIVFVFPKLKFRLDFKELIPISAVAFSHFGGFVKNLVKMSAAWT